MNFEHIPISDVAHHLDEKIPGCKGHGYSFDYTISCVDGQMISRYSSNSAFAYGSTVHQPSSDWPFDHLEDITLKNDKPYFYTVT